jgi:TRAP-type C4-dicarboxylate transport system permease small subunit
VFSLFVAFVVCGISFYLLLFVSLMAEAVMRGVNPAATPGLQAGLRQIALPISLGLAVVAFLLSFWHLGRQERVAAAVNRSNKAAV